MKQYAQPLAELLLFSPDDIMAASDDFELKIDWFKTDNGTAEQMGNSDQSAM